jgi:hypothetical protein
VELICLANSVRPDGRCIAGIDPATGRWVRPIPCDGDAIPEARCVVDRRLVAPLDVLELQVAPPAAATKYQCENQALRGWDWAVRGRLNEKALVPYMDGAAPILHTPGDRVVPALLEKLPPGEWKSLQLVRPRGLRFEPVPNVPHRWRAVFRDARRNEYALKLTDPEATRRLEHGEPIREPCLLTVSLTRPWAPDVSRLKMCYKLVAAVIEV